MAPPQIADSNDSRSASSDEVPDQSMSPNPPKSPVGLSQKKRGKRRADNNAPDADSRKAFKNAEGKRASISSGASNKTGVIDLPAVCTACNQRKVACDGVKPHCGPCVQVSNGSGRILAACDWIMEEECASPLDTEAVQDPKISSRTRRVDAIELRMRNIENILALRRKSSGGEASSSKSVDSPISTQSPLRLPESRRRSVPTLLPVPIGEISSVSPESSASVDAVSSDEMRRNFEDHKAAFKMYDQSRHSPHIPYPASGIGEWRGAVAAQSASHRTDNHTPSPLTAAFLNPQQATVQSPQPFHPYSHQDIQYRLPPHTAYPPQSSIELPQSWTSTKSYGTDWSSVASSSQHALPTDAYHAQPSHANPEVYAWPQSSDYTDFEQPYATYSQTAGQTLSPAWNALSYESRSTPTPSDAHQRRDSTYHHQQGRPIGSSTESPAVWSGVKGPPIPVRKKSQQAPKAIDYASHPAYPEGENGQPQPSYSHQYGYY